MTRAYLRLDPGFYERKAIDQGYSLSAVAALVGVLCLADSQPQRGSFRDEKLLRVLLGPAGRYVPELIARGDLCRDGARIYVDGWKEWQEGDLTVADRMARLRNRKRNGAVTPDVTPRLAEAEATEQSVSGGGPPSRGPRFSNPPKAGEHRGQHPDCLVCAPLRAAAGAA